jgi:predicted protein tyrosine phosphatase
MTITDVDFVSRTTAEAHLFFPDSAIISITDPGKPVARLLAHFSPVLRLSFFDAIPGDDFIPLPVRGCFDLDMARRIHAFVDDLSRSSRPYRLIAHCEQGVSRSAAVALFVESYAGAALAERWRAHEANTWVIVLFGELLPQLALEIPEGGVADHYEIS